MKYENNSNRNFPATKIATTTTTITHSINIWSKDNDDHYDDDENRENGGRRSRRQGKEKKTSVIKKNTYTKIQRRIRKIKLKIDKARTLTK